MEFTDDEIETIKKLIDYFGFGCTKKPEFEKVRELAKKIGMSNEWIKIYL